LRRGADNSWKDKLSPEEYGNLLAKEIHILKARQFCESSDMCHISRLSIRTGTDKTPVWIIGAERDADDSVDSGLDQHFPGRDVLPRALGVPDAAGGCEVDTAERENTCVHDKKSTSNRLDPFVDLHRTGTERDICYTHVLKIWETVSPNISRCHDLRSLLQCQWLNDQAISEYLDAVQGTLGLAAVVLDSRRIERALQQDQEQTSEDNEEIKMLIEKSSAEVYCPFNIDNRHWILLLFKPDVKVLQVYDPRGNPLPEITRRFRWFLGEEWTVEHPDIHRKHRQSSSNGSDCGVFVCLYCAYFMRGQKLDFQQSDIENMRKLIAYRIYEQKKSCSNVLVVPASMNSEASAATASRAVAPSPPASSTETAEGADRPSTTAVANPFATRPPSRSSLQLELAEVADGGGVGGVRAVDGGLHGPASTPKNRYLIHVPV
jgi:hypothetical protein